MRATRWIAFALTMWRQQARQIDPTDKSLLVIRNNVKPQNKKYFAFPEGQNSGISVAIPSRQGASAIVTNVGRVAVDVGCR